LYLLACEKPIEISWLPSVMGPITPIGGLCFIAGWVTLGIAASRIRYK
jgi:uncharacterized membrane protein YgdD (TMEM256/DUF423 family)